MLRLRARGGVLTRVKVLSRQEEYTKGLVLALNQKSLII